MAVVNYYFAVMTWKSGYVDGYEATQLGPFPDLPVATRVRKWFLDQAAESSYGYASEIWGVEE